MNRQVATLLALLAVGIVAIAAFVWFDPGDTEGVLDQNGATKPIRDADALAGGGNGDRDRPATPEAIRSQQPDGTDSASGPRIEITGQLLDRDDQPLVGQALELKMLPDGMAQWMNLEQIGWLGWLRSIPRHGETITTDDAGRFRFPAPSGRGGWVALVGDQLVVEKGSLAYTATRENVDLGAAKCIKASAVAGVVLGPGDRPVEGAKVRISRQQNHYRGGQQPHVKTDANGKFRLAGLRAGKYHLRTASAKHVPAQQPIDVEAQRERDDVVVRLAIGKQISGQVLDDRGAPVVGAKVTGHARGRTGSYKLDGAELMMPVSVPGASQSEPTETDERGMFTLHGLAGEQVTVRADAKGHVAASSKPTPLDGRSADLRLTRTATVRGFLIDEQKNPLAGSRVSARKRQKDGASASQDLLVYHAFAGDHAVSYRGWPGGASTKTDDTGAFILEGIPPGDIELHANGEHRPAKLSDITLQPGEVRDGIKLEAVLGCILRVTVTRPDGKPVADAHVQVEQLRGQRSHNLIRSLDGGGGWASAMLVPGAHTAPGKKQFSQVDSGKTDPSGVATIAGLEAGPTRLSVRHRDWVQAKSREFELTGGKPVEREVEVSAGGLVAVTTLDADGRAFGNVPFVIEAAVKPSASPMPFRQSGTAGRTDGRGSTKVGPLAPGRYAAFMRPVPKAGSNPAPFDINRKLLASRFEFTVQRDQLSEIALRQPPLTRMIGRVENGNGEPLTGSSTLSGPGLPYPQHTQVKNGAFAFDSLEAGQYRLTFKARGSQLSHSLSVSVTGQAEQHVPFVCRAGGIRVKVIGPDGKPVVGAQVTAQTKGGSVQQPFLVAGELLAGRGSARGKTGADGTALIEGLPPGSYSLSVRATGFAHFSAPEAPVRADAISERTAPLIAGGGIAITVRGQKGWIQVRAEQIGAGKPATRTASVRNGKGVISGLPPGRYKVSARNFAPGGAKSGPRQTVDVVAGKSAPVVLDAPK